MESVAPVAARRWTIPRVLGHLLLVAVVFLAAQFVGLLGVISVRAAIDPRFDVDAWMEQVDTDGAVLAAAAWASTLACVPLIVWLAKRDEGGAWKFLRFERVSLKTCATWTAGAILLIAVTDLVMMSLDRPAVPDVQLLWYLNGSPVIFFLTLVVAAPLFEELFFRGYLMSALQRVGVPLIAGAAISAAFWALIHVQYDAIYMSVIFLLGLALAAARIRTGSVLPCLAMHAVANVVAFVETAYVAASSA